MAHYGTLRDFKFANASEDIRGAQLYGTNDDKLGKIDDVIFDHQTAEIRYAIVDTGGWLSTKQFVVPAHQIHASAKHDGAFEVPLSKEQIESFPPYKESDVESEGKWSDYEERYRSKWETNPVMHRKETDRNITPTTQQIPGNSASSRAAAATQGWTAVPGGRGIGSKGGELEAADRSTDRIVPAGTDTVVVDNSAAGIGGRWDTFQSRLRERRKEAVTGCRTCVGDSATGHANDSTDTLRKAV